MMVTLKSLNAATLTVQRDLYFMGFWDQGSRVTRTDVFWCAYPVVTSPLASGLFYHETGWLDSILGFIKGHIFIPRWSLSISWGKNASLRDIVRHEYAHAVAHYYPMLIQRSERFRQTFGGDYNASEHSRAGESDEFVSKYAQTDPSEDFAETFMLHLKHLGELPKRFNTPAIKKKWCFVSDLGRVVRSGKSKW
jgi:Putative zinc-binding metallo-peptidase